PPTASISVEQLAERLRVMEEMNRKLAAELERTNRQHDEQMKQILAKFAELSGRSKGREEAGQNKREEAGLNRREEAGRDMGEAVGTAPPAVDVQAADTDNPVPDYTEGQFAPYSPPTGYPVSSVSDPKRLPLKGTFGPGFQFQTENEEFLLRIHYE